jgi:hypothetical protein
MRQQGGAGGGPGAAAGGPSTRPRRGDGAGTSGGGETHRGTVWIKDGNLLKPVKVIVGETDGTNSAITSDELPEGAEVVIGESRGEAGGDEARNPFMPQFGRRR